MIRGQVGPCETGALELSGWSVCFSRKQTPGSERLSQLLAELLKLKGGVSKDIRVCSSLPTRVTEDQREGGVWRI